MEQSWSIEENTSAEDLGVISNGVLAYGRSQAVDGNARPLACLLRASGQVIAGASGRTEYNRLFVSYLWVREDMRGQGLGSRALLEIEHAARERGCVDALIETLLDRNAQLYQRLGYVAIVRIDGYVGPFHRYIMVKRLAHDK
jgi:GNAT superfamily N-acetyltransferase